MWAALHQASSPSPRTAPTCLLCVQRGHLGPEHVSCLDRDPRIATFSQPCWRHRALHVLMPQGPVGCSAGALPAHPLQLGTDLCECVLCQLPLHPRCLRAWSLLREPAVSPPLTMELLSASMCGGDTGEVEGGSAAPQLPHKAPLKILQVPLAPPTAGWLWTSGEGR